MHSVLHDVVLQFVVVSSWMAMYLADLCFVKRNNAT